MFSSSPKQKSDGQSRGLRVSGEYILLSDIEEQYSAAKEQSGDKLPPQYRCSVLDQIMISKLLVNQAKIDSLYPKDEEVESQLTARVEKILDYMGGNTEQFVALLSRHGSRRDERADAR
ncbi:MAG: hypothetical protein U5L45_21030 [Saprospiraceae bacterium]|nr:hypothetical protein [Saprospiraceae bacterium]